METGLDISNYFNRDVSLKIMTCLDDLSYIDSVSSVFPDWLNWGELKQLDVFRDSILVLFINFVEKFHLAIDDRLAKNLCLSKFPQLSRVDHVVEHCCIARNPWVEGGSSNMEWETLKKEHRVYAFLARGCKSSAESEHCISEPIEASSTHLHPLEAIENTLEEFNGVPWSYWSSEGQINPAVPETLTYKLVADLCVITEIRIKPFQANFQPGSPIYSARSVRFRMGHSLRDDYVWTYTSDEFPMVQEADLQPFTLPEPVLCIGGILQIELRGRVQAPPPPQGDGLFYICVERVQGVGRPLSSFGIEIREDPEKFVLKALSCTHPPLPEETREDDSGQDLDSDVDSAESCITDLT
ncbi:hypothetical protein SLEP1_g2548 [Rubroshorea leprosula]|uniref:F-box protein n=1 Tax=Rubroshorea leprosula TaxID=152421 RepID=A0AAV5HS24_9ROSI|nr:hypothetical protein SLEP1_g2548 [Rubroshorea leprosula]